MIPAGPGLVLGGGAEGVADGMDPGGAVGAWVVDPEGAGVVAAGLGTADVGPVPDWPPGDGAAAPHAAKPTSAAAAAASRSGVAVLMISACAARTGPESSISPVLGG